jgi:hypothetical protein
MTTTHKQLNTILGSQYIGAGLAQQVAQYANCPITLGGIVEPTTQFLRSTVPASLNATGETLVSSLTGFVDLTAGLIFLAIFFIFIFIIVLLALTRLIDWLTALLLIVGGFALLYLLGTFYRVTVENYVRNNFDQLNGKLKGVLRNADIHSVFESFLGANRKSLVACNGLNQG